MKGLGTVWKWLKEPWHGPFRHSHYLKTTPRWYIVVYTYTCEHLTTWDVNRFVTENVILSWIIMFTPFWHFTEESITKEKKTRQKNRYKNNLPLQPRICLFFFLSVLKFSPLFKWLFRLKCTSLYLDVHGVSVTNTVVGFWPENASTPINQGF